MKWAFFEFQTLFVFRFDILYVLFVAFLDSTASTLHEVLRKRGRSGASERWYMFQQRFRAERIIFSILNNNEHLFINLASVGGRRES